MARSARTSEFRIGEHLIRPNINQIGDERIDPKAMEVLLTLAYDA